MTTFITPDYTIGNSADCQTQMIGVLQNLDQALQALLPAPNATTVQFNDTVLVADGAGNTNVINPISQTITNYAGDTNTQTATSMNITDSASSGNSSYSYNGISINGTQGSFFASPTNLAVENGGSLAILDNGSGTLGTSCLQVSNGTETIQYTSQGINLTSTNLNIGGGGLNMGGNNIDAVNNINLNTINGYAPTTIGLTWSDFNAGNAYYGLPNNSYQLNNPSVSNYTTTQSNLQFNIFNSNTNNYTTLTENTLSTTNQDLNIIAGSGANIINLECSSLTINGNPLSTSLVYSFPATTSYLYYNSSSSPFGSTINIPTGTYTITYTISFDAGSYNQPPGNFAMIRGCVGMYISGTNYYPNGYSSNYLPSTLLAYDSSFPCFITAVDTISISSGGSAQMFAFQTNNQGTNGNATFSATLVLQ
jgi:hypothetical protein